MTDYYDESDPNREFNPLLSGEDAEMVATAKRHRQALEYAQRQEQAEEIGKFYNESIAEALKAEGLEGKDVQELFESNPDIVKESIRRSIQGHASRMKSSSTRLRNAKGQYTKQAPPGQAPAPSRADLSHDEVRSQARYGQQETTQPSGGKKTAALKAKTDKGYLPNEEELLDIIGELFE